MAHKVVYNACYGGFALSTEAEHWLLKHGVTVVQIEEFSLGNDRHNTKLVECVETLGDECNGFSACLSVTEIEGNIYRIEGYDGFETVVEPNEDTFIAGGKIDYIFNNLGIEQCTVLSKSECLSVHIIYVKETTKSLVSWRIDIHFIFIENTIFNLDKYLNIDSLKETINTWH